MVRRNLSNFVALVVTKSATAIWETAVETGLPRETPLDYRAVYPGFVLEESTRREFQFLNSEVA